MASVRCRNGRWYYRITVSKASKLYDENIEVISIKTGMKWGLILVLYFFREIFFLYNGTVNIISKEVLYEKNRYCYSWCFRTFRLGT